MRENRFASVDKSAFVIFIWTVVSLFILCFLLGLFVGEKRICESMGLGYSWDYSKCLSVQKE